MIELLDAAPVRGALQKITDLEAAQRDDTARQAFADARKLIEDAVNAAANPQFTDGFDLITFARMRGENPATWPLHARYTECTVCGDETAVGCLNREQHMDTGMTPTQAEHLLAAKGRNTSGVYIVWAMGTDRYKIGYTTGMFARFGHLFLNSPVGLALVAFINGADQQFERSLHQRFERCRVRGEWFHETPELRALISEHAI